MKIAVLFITYNAENTLGSLLPTIKEQTIKPDYVMAIDISSRDKTTDILKSYDIPYHTIKMEDFNHGTTRRYAISLVDADIYILLTQDVSFVNKDAIGNILNAFYDPKIGCAYGRQLPNKNANFLVKHLQLFDFPEVSYVRTYEDRKIFGRKACFNSDNFAAYRKEALLSIGEIPKNVFFAEDMYMAAKMLKRGWQIAYCANAMIYHSHNFTLFQEFKRCFDTGAFHAMQPWIFKNFPCHINEWITYLKSALLHSIKHNKYSVLPKIFSRLFVKYIGFLFGQYHQLIPHFVKIKISTCDYFWQQLDKNKQNFN
jgi:rhamnosyltransferase